jgi:tRNA (guanine-N7-)-methyltransferase
MSRIRTHTNPFNYYKRLEKLDLTDIFKNYSGKIDFEIGFGRGQFILNYGASNPDRLIIGVEVRKNITLEVQEQLNKLDLPNVHLIHGHGQILLEDGFQAPLIENCFVFHPDPWFKKRHQKRRVINPIFLQTIHSRMLPTGKLYLSTDVPILWEGMLETIQESNLFTEIEDPEFWEKHYTTNWSNWSITDKRKAHTGTFKKILHDIR